MNQLPNLNEHEDDTRDTIEGIFCNLFKRNKEQMTSSVGIVFIVFNLKLHLKVSRQCYPRRFATAILSSTQRCNIVGTLFRINPTLFQHCNDVLR